MNRSKLKTYAPQARRDFIRAMTDRAAFYGLTKDKIEPVTVQGDVALIGGKAFPASIAAKRERLRECVERSGFEQTMEAMAYTWFNRLVAIRYMELHGYLDHGYRVLSHPEGKPTPEIVEHAEHVDLPGLDRDEVIHLKLEGTKEAELYRKLLIAQCNALHAAMPFLFERIADETELLLPDSLLHSDSLVRKLVIEIDEADWQAVEIIGWLYQFYISEKKEEVIGSVVKSEDIPAATQLFTPNWIVKYLVQNSLGRQWLATYPDSPLKAEMEFYIEAAEQTPEVQAQLKAITTESLNPEELTFLDPACGSGHILVEAYSLLKGIYLERGYRLRDIPKLILTKNLFGLEIDDRAAQLAAFSLLMMARADDRNILSSGITLNVLAIQQTDHLDTEALLQAFSHTRLPAKAQPTSSEFGFMNEVRSPLYANTPAADPLVADLRQLLDFFKGAKTFGSLLQVPPVLAAKIPVLRERTRALEQTPDLTTVSIGVLGHLVRQAELLSQQFYSAAANPPYMGARQGMNDTLKTFIDRNFPDYKADLYAAFVARAFQMVRHDGNVAMVTMQSWMFLPSYEALRENILSSRTLYTLAQLGPRAFSTISGIVVQVAAFACACSHQSGYRPTFFKLTQGEEDHKRESLLQRRNAYTHSVLEDFSAVNGSPLSFWTPPATRAHFRTNPPLSAVAQPRQGMASSDDGRFVRRWFEVSWSKIALACGNNAEAVASKAKWFPYNKGGTFRRWYGNNDHVVNWENGGQEVRQYASSLYGSATRTIKSMDMYFREGITWSAVASKELSVRYTEKGFIFSNGGMKLFSAEGDSGETLFEHLGLLNSSATPALVSAISETLNFDQGVIARIPVARCPEAITPVMRLIELAKQDWDRRETSWDFQIDPVLAHAASDGQLSAAVKRACEDAAERKGDIAQLEGHNNKLWSRVYGVDASDVRQESPPSIEQEDLQTPQPTLLSFFVGCLMGRYSLDSPGLIYAKSGNEGFDPSAYATLPADKDGIIPVTEEHWFPDDAAARFEEFVGKAWSAEHLDENLAFVAEGLGAKAGEPPRQTIRRYMSDGFYKHHLSKSMYKNRPIYWLFTSGKQRAFQALVYLHRYNEGTLSRMRTEYVIPLQGKIAGRIEKLEGDKAQATSTSHRRNIEKAQEKLRKQQTELVAFDEKLRHYADLRIKLDLDDGVKANYRKFADPAIGEIVAEVKAVCGKEDDE